MKFLTHATFFLITMASLAGCASAKIQKQADRNIETVRLWFDLGWNQNRHEELIERCFSPDWSDGNPLLPDESTGHDGMRRLVISYRKTFPDAHFDISHLYGNEKYVTIRYNVTATHGGDAFGIPPTGRKFTTTGMVLYEMENGRIKHSWQELDVLTILNQLRTN